MKMELKFDENGQAIIRDGKPVYDRDGQEVELDAAELFNKIGLLNQESANRRHKENELTEKLKQFEQIGDVTEALKAIETVKNLSDKKLLDAGEVEKIKAEMAKTFETSKTDFEAKLQQKDKQLESFFKKEAFSKSTLLKQTIFADTPEFAEKLLGDYFKGELTDNGYKFYAEVNGTRLKSASNPFEDAGFDEALQVIINNHPRKDNLLRGGAAGSGGTGSHENNTLAGSKKFSEMTEQEKMNYIGKHGHKKYKELVARG